MSSARVNSSDLFRAITPSDVTATTGIRSIYIQATGNVALEDKQGNAVTFAVTVGQVLPVQPAKVLATGTTATVIGLF